MSQKKTGSEDKISKPELLADVGAGIGGALFGALLSPMMARQAGVPLTAAIGQELLKRREVFTAPFLSQISRDDERAFAGVEVRLDKKHNEIPYRDILTLLLKRMGPWASDRFRAIVIAIPNAPKEGKDDVPTKDLRVKFLEETILDIIRFNGEESKKENPNFDVGIEEVLKNLKIRNIADVDSASAQLSRWWNDKPFETTPEQLRSFLCSFFGVKSVSDINKSIISAKAEKLLAKVDVPDVRMPRKNDNAGFFVRFMRNITPGSFPNKEQNLDNIQPSIMSAEKPTK